MSITLTVKIRGIELQVRVKSDDRHSAK